MNHRLAIILSTAAISIAAVARETVSLNPNWEFEAPDGSKTVVDLPHDFLISQPWVAPDANDKGDSKDIAANVKSRLSSRGFKEMGRGTYRKTLFVPDSLKGQRVLLDFGGIMLVGDVYLNGERIGGTDYGYLGFECDITDKARYGADNELVVIADTGDATNSRWYTGGGLYRNVDMVTTNPDLYFNRHGLQVLFPTITDGRATIQLVGDINVKQRDESFTADVEIIDPNGNVVATKSETVKVLPNWRNREYDLGTIDVEAPMLWDLDTPNMYTVNITLKRPNGKVADAITEDFGIRTIEFSPEFGMKLNGKKVLLKGIANHHTLGALGAAAYPRAIEKRIKLLKDFGFNHIRTSHNPYSKEFLDICDRNGILVVDELYDKWLTQYAGGRKDWAELWQKDVPEWVKRDRNHPSVVLWSLGNELQGYNNLPYNDWGVTAYKLQKQLLDRYDTTRLVTVAMHPRYRSLETDSVPAPLVFETDVAAYNYRHMYFPGDHKRWPWMMFYQSEASLSDMGPNFFKPNNDEVIGLAYWGMIDYLGESLGWPAKGWSDGVFDISLDPKPNAWFLKSMFVEEPVVKIGVVNPGGRLVDWNGVKIGGDVLSDSWNYNAGDTLKLYTYTNADEVELLLNGKSIGRQKNDMNPNKRNRITWTKVPYKAGRLTAVAYKDGKVVSRDEIQTAGKPVKLVAEIDNPEWQADGMDLQHIKVTAVDSKGRKVHSADADVHFAVEGNARLVAVSNGDMTSDELHTQDHRHLYNGSAMAILRSTADSGPVTLTITADGYKPLKVLLNTF